MTPEDQARPRLRPRAFVFGVFMAAFLSYVSLYGNMMVKTTYLSIEFCTAGAMFFLFLFVAVLNPLLRLMGKVVGSAEAFVFSSAELLLVYIMMVVPSAVCSMGLVESFLPILTGSHYYATVENDWKNLVWPHEIPWTFVSDSEAVRYFYEGKPEHMGIPWRAWLVPLGMWTAFLLVLYYVSVCIVSLLRKQWIEKERLLFPLVHLPLTLVGEGHGTEPRILRNRLMWIGFAIPFIITSLNCIHHHYPFAPLIQLDKHVPILGGIASYRLHFSFVVCGFSFLLSTDIALSLWFFHIIGRLQTGISRYLGFETGEAGPFCHDAASVSHQAMGAMIVFVIFMLWMSRDVLKQALRQAFRTGASVEDADELIAHGRAMRGIFFGFVFLSLWLWRAGMAWWIVVPFLLSAFVVFLALTRVVAQGGVAFGRPALIPQIFVVYALGSEALGAATLIALGYTFIWVADVRTLVMASTANSLKLATEVRLRRRVVFWAISVSLLVGLVTSYITIMKLAYAHGGINLSGWFFRGAPQYPFRWVSGMIKTPVSPDKIRWAFNGVGGLMMGGLLFMQYRFIWWPLHPIGFLMGNSSPIAWSWTGIFVAWLVKVIVLRYGGAKLYRKMRPFFLGLILGQFTAASFWLFFDWIFDVRSGYVPIL